MEDRHHIIHPRQEWTLRPEARQIRENPSMIVRLDRDIHEELHEDCPPVPLLGFYSLRRTVMGWYPDEDTIRSMDNLMGAIEHSTRHPKVHPVERELASLAIEAIELQKPHIRPKTANVIDLGVFKWKRNH